MSQILKTCGTILGSIILLGCATASKIPQSITKQDVLLGQTPLPPQLTLGEALARAALYNLDNRVRVMEGVIATGKANLEHFNMLPEMTLTAGYFRRDREDLSSSRNAINGLTSPATGTSADREQLAGALAETWNVLDFGIALVRSDQLRAYAQAASQRRRQSLQNILNETRYAYARADIAQRTTVEVDRMLEEINSALATKELLERSGAAVPLIVLQQRRDLLAIYSELLTLRQPLVSAQRELNVLISLTPGAHVKLVPQAKATVPAPLSLLESELQSLEILALLMHPELRAADSQVVVHHREIRRTFLSMMPSLEISNVGSYDSNDFRFYSVYSTLGAKVTHNLINLYRLPKIQQHSRKRLELEEKKRLALSLAVITKFHVTLANFNALRAEYEFATDQVTTSDALARIMRSRYQSGEIALHERLSAELFALDARLSAELLGAELVSAAGQIYTNLGIDIVPAGTATNDLSVLTGVLEGQVRALSDLNQKLISLAAEKAPLSL